MFLHGSLIISVWGLCNYKDTEITRGRKRKKSINLETSLVPERDFECSVFPEI